MPDPTGPHESVQLFQEHAAATTRKYPFRVAPSTLTALGVFTLLAALGLSIQVREIRGKLTDPDTMAHEEELPPEEIERKPTAPALSPESMEAQRRAAKEQVRQYGEAADRALAALIPDHVAKLEGESLSERTNAALALREHRSGCLELIRLLTAGSTTVRREAANALSLSSNAPTRASLLALLTALENDSDALTREYAAHGVGRFAHALAHPDDPALKEGIPLANLITTESVEESESEGAEEGGVASDELVTRAIEALAKAARSDGDGYVREAAVFGLAWVQDMRALPVFAETLEGREVRGSASAALGMVRLALLYKRDALPEEHRDIVLRVCRRMMKSANERIRARGAEAAGLFRSAAATDTLLAQMDETTETSWEARARAAEALGRLYERKAAVKSDEVAHIVQRVVLSEAFDPEAAVRWKCREALQRMAYNANRWGRLEMLETAPKEALEGATAREFWGEGGHEH